MYRNKILCIGTTEERTGKFNYYWKDHLIHFKQLIRKPCGFLRNVF